MMKIKYIIIVLIKYFELKKHKIKFVFLYKNYFDILL